MPPLSASAQIAVVRPSGGSAHHHRPSAAEAGAAFAGTIEAVDAERPDAGARQLSTETKPMHPLKRAGAAIHSPILPEADEVVPAFVDLQPLKASLPGKAANNPSASAENHKVAGPAAKTDPDDQVSSCENPMSADQGFADPATLACFAEMTGTHEMAAPAASGPAAVDDAGGTAQPDETCADAIQPAGIRSGQAIRSLDEPGTPDFSATLDSKPGDDVVPDGAAVTPTPIADKHQSLDPLASPAAHGGAGQMTQIESVGPASAPPPSPPIAAVPRWTAEANHAIALRISHAIRTGESSITVDLHPADLGHVSVRLAFQNNGVDVRMVVERHETFQTLNQERASLEQELRGAGVNLDGRGLDLRFGQPSDHSRERGWSGARPAGERAPPDTSEPSPRRLHGLLNIFA